MPSDNKTTTQNMGSKPPSGVGQQLSNVSVEVKSKASELGRMAVDKVDEQRDAAAGGLASAATAIHENADNLPGGRAVSGAAHKAADALSSTADYIRQHDVDSMMSDFYRLVRNNPGPALLGAAFLGFLVARSFSNEQ